MRDCGERLRDSPNRLKTSSLGRFLGGPWNMLSSYSSAFSTYLENRREVRKKNKDRFQLPQSSKCNIYLNSLPTSFCMSLT